MHTSLLTLSIFPPLFLQPDPEESSRVLPPRPDQPAAAQPRAGHPGGWEPVSLHGHYEAVLQRLVLIPLDWSQSKVQIVGWESFGSSRFKSIIGGHNSINRECICIQFFIKFWYMLTYDSSLVLLVSIKSLLYNILRKKSIFEICESIWIARRLIRDSNAKRFPTPTR